MIYCTIAELCVEIPTVGDLFPRCEAYLNRSQNCIDIEIRKDEFRKKRYNWSIDDNSLAYMESAYQFYLSLVDYNGMYLHSSAVELDGKAYLFSGPCGMGKSTHTRLWQSVFGEKARVFNDDKPALRRMEDRWYAYGTPWCGKDGININMKVPLAGICFLKQAPENRIRRLTKQEAMQKILSQTIHKFPDIEKLDLLLSHVDKLVREIPVYELENRPEPEAALLSYETMRRGAEEAGL